MPNQKAGMEIPRKVMVEVALSKNFPLRIAPDMPSGMAITRAIRKAVPDSWRVGASFSPISSSTGRRDMKLRPQSPVTMPFSQLRYWICTGWSRP